jgi:hypothetical protein
MITKGFVPMSVIVIGVVPISVIFLGAVGMGLISVAAVSMGVVTVGITTMEVAWAGVIGMGPLQLAQGSASSAVMFSSKGEAEARAKQLGCSGAHQHGPDGKTWVPCTTMDDFLKVYPAASGGAGHQHMHKN